MKWRTRHVFLLNLIASYVFYAGILIALFLNTHRMGFPTVSRMLADDTPLTGVYMGAAIVYGDLRVIGTSEQMRGNAGNVWLHIVTAIAFVCGMLQIVFMVLVGLFDLDYDVMIHYWIAGAFGVFSILRALFLLIRRWYLGAPPAVLFFNTLHLLTTLTLMILFPILAFMNGYEAVHIAVIEYLIFWLIQGDPAWQLFDFPHDAVGLKNC